MITEVDDAEDDLLAGQLGEDGAIELRLRGLDGDRVTGARRQLR